MAPLFCPKCGSIMTITRQNNKTIAICQVCGHREEISKKANPSNLKPVEVEEETSVKRGIIKDKELRRITIDEDTVKEALDQLGGSSED